ncbi:uncharacterized protein LOC135812131 isoform X2 [Sycon ciliatum]|uniref:uncharacterized protein LOC135812131 isoform X2 n=1 Tax=Sycon ciliatum TaxID=27933 RepID=UPI0031F670E1
MAIGGCSPLRFLAIASTVIFCTQPVDVFWMLELYRFDNQEVSEFSARCVDGSPSGFYFEPGLQSRKRGFYFKGGGLCASKESCQARTESDLGSSNSWASAMSGFGLVSSNASENNGVCMWNHVYLSWRHALWPANAAIFLWPLDRRCRPRTAAESPQPQRPHRLRDGFPDNSCVAR